VRFGFLDSQIFRKDAGFFLGGDLGGRNCCGIARAGVYRRRGVPGLVETRCESGPDVSSDGD